LVGVEGAEYVIGFWQRKVLRPALARAQTFFRTKPEIHRKVLYFSYLCPEMQNF